MWATLPLSCADHWVLTHWRRSVISRLHFYSSDELYSRNEHVVQGGGAAAGPASDGALAGLAGQSHLLNWADKTFGQGLSSLTKGDSLLLVRS